MAYVGTNEDKVTAEERRSLRLNEQLARIGDALLTTNLLLKEITRNGIPGTGGGGGGGGCTPGGNACISCPEITSLLNATTNTAQTLKVVHEAADIGARNK